MGFDLVFVASYAFACGDTWASECGILSARVPRLITSLEQVPPGTNGGVTPVGLIASALGGGTVGYIFALVAGEPILESMGLGVIGGFAGSMVDSLLGATVQETRFDVKKRMVCEATAGRTSTVVVAGHNYLDNHQVNFLSSVITGLGVPL